MENFKEKELEKEIENAANKLLEEELKEGEDVIRLDTLNKLTGRDFKSIEDFEKHYKHL